MSWKRRIAFKYLKHYLSENRLNDVYLRTSLDSEYYGAVWCRHRDPYNPDKFMIDLNRDHIKYAPWDILLDTIRHEIAHVLAAKDKDYYATQKDPHGEMWQKYADSLQVRY